MFAATASFRQSIKDLFHVRSLGQLVEYFKAGQSLKTHRLDSSVSTVIIDIPSHVTIYRAPVGQLRLDGNTADLKTVLVSQGATSVQVSALPGTECRIPIEISISLPSPKTVVAKGQVDLALVDVLQHQLSLEASDGVTLTAAGVVEHLSLKVKGDTKVKLNTLHAKHALLEVNTDSELEVSASETLEISAVGNSRIHVGGNPSKSDARISGRAQIYYY